jgi:hypothetical protein
MATDSVTGLPFQDFGDPISDAERTEVRIDRGSEQPPVTDPVELLYLSKDGAKLLAPSCLKIEEAVVLRIAVPGLKQELVLPASVRWRQPASGDTWRLGCTFTEQLPQDVLCELARLGHIDRRKDPRRAVDLPAQVRWELAKDTFPARITSLSPGGLCVRCCHGGKIGERLVVQLDSGDAGLALVHARSVWQRATGGDYLIGCALASRADYELVCASMRSGGAGRPDDGGLSRRAAILGLAVLAALAAALLAMFFIPH